MQIRANSNVMGREEPTAIQVVIGHNFFSSALAFNNLKDGAGIERRYLYPNQAELDLEM
jgi:hypothetical protein